MPDLPPAAAQALRNGRPELPALLKAAIPNHGVKPLPTADQAIRILELFLQAIQMEERFSVLDITVKKTGDALTIRAKPAR